MFNECTCRFLPSICQLKLFHYNSYRHILYFCKIKWIPEKNSFFFKFQNIFSVILLKMKTNLWNLVGGWKDNFLWLVIQKKNTYSLLNFRVSFFFLWLNKAALILFWLSNVHLPWFWGLMYPVLFLIGRCTR